MMITRVDDRIKLVHVSRDFSANVFIGACGIEDCKDKEQIFNTERPS